jgi:hypothetical protein
MPAWSSSDTAERLISPLEGEMPGRAEGGEARPAGHAPGIFAGRLGRITRATSPLEEQMPAWSSSDTAERLISPLEGEMPGRAEGGEAHPVSLR